MGNAVKISFEGKNIFIDWGKKDISGTYKQSKHGKYFIVCDTLFGPTTSTESAVVFTKSDILYIKKMPEDQDIGYYSVFDDGSCIIFTDDYFILVGPDGKQVTKKKIHGDVFWENDSMIACFGAADNDEDGELFIFHPDSREIIRKKITTMIVESCDEDGEAEENYLYGYDVEVKFTGEKFIFVYDDEKNAVAFDTFGNQVEFDKLEVTQIISKKHEREHKQKVDNARQEFEYWTKRSLKAKNARDISDATRSKQKANDYAEKLEMLGEPVPEMEQDLVPSSISQKRKGILARLFRKK